MLRFCSMRLAAVLVFGCGVACAQAQDYPILNRIADKLVQKYQSASCEQLKAEKGQAPSGTKEEMERRAIEMLIAVGSRPDGRERHHVGEVQRRDRRLAHIGIDVPRQAPKPGFNGIYGLGDAGEVAALDDLLDQP